MNIQDKLKNYNAVAKYENGLSTVEIAKEVGCNPGTVWYFLKNNGIKTKQRAENYGKSSEYKDQIISLFNEGYSCYKISKKLGLGKSTVERMMKANNIDISFRSTARQDPIRNHTKEIIDSYIRGDGTSVITKRFNCGTSTIWKILEENGIPTKMHQYKVKEDFFDKIDTEEKAYILGYWYADGCVDDSGKLRISITDLEIVEKFKNILGFDGDIWVHKQESENHKTQYELCINRQRLAKQLIDKGCVPNKSLILKWPTLNQVPEHLISHFCRGYFDGDGSISGGKTTSISITSCIYFLEGLYPYLQKLGIDKHIYNRWPKRATTTRMLMFWKKSQVNSFIEWLYRDAAIYLTRKYNKCMEFKNVYNSSGGHL